jgi:DNA-binding NtrC family response regulator
MDDDMNDHRGHALASPPGHDTSHRTRPTALVVDDDVDFRESLAVLVRREGFEVQEAGSLAEAREHLAVHPTALVIIDVGLPDGRGLDLLGEDDPLESRPELIVVTGNATVGTAVDALRQGVLDFLTKPIDHHRLRAVLANVMRVRGLRDERDALRGELRDLGRFGKIVGRSQPMQKVYDFIMRVAPTKVLTLLLGESGTGKELVAETIHKMSQRASQRYLAVNCGAIAQNVIESELFGHEKGSFTGAERNRRGYFEEASGGTLFLDEITETPLDVQVKLLRVLETGTLMRVGASEPIPVDVRILAATNRDPMAAVRDGKLREDLYYRLNVFPIVLPPLRSRGDEDIDLLAQHFLTEFNAREGVERRWSREALRRLHTYPWPGNVRELRNVVDRSAIMAHDIIDDPGLPESAPPPAMTTEANGPSVLVPLGEPLEETERKLILSTLEMCEGDKKETARRLGISLKTLYNRLNVYEAARRREDPEGTPA